MLAHRRISTTEQDQYNVQKRVLDQEHIEHSRKRLLQEHMLREIS
jgi:hypothetical protein